MYSKSVYIECLFQQPQIQQELRGIDVDSKHPVYQISFAFKIRTGFLVVNV